MILSVTDANIFIDLIQIELLDHFLDLDLEVWTVHEVLGELDLESEKLLRKKISKGNLNLGTIQLDSIPIIAKSTPARLSVADKAVIVYSLDIKAMVLTGDNLLRKTCESMGLEVHGILWILEKLVSENIIKTSRAAKALQKLLEENPRLPLEECNALLKKWAKGND